MKRLLALTAVMATGAAVPVSAAPEPLPLSATYETMTILVDTVLTEDYDGRIVMGADNVTLDCAGHTITGPGRLEGLPGVSVSNGQV